jgi:hypothetical protein
MRGIGQKIPLHHQLADLPLSVIACNHLPVDRMQLVNVCNAHLLRDGTSARKCRRNVLYCRQFPSAYLGRVNAILLG